MSSYEVGWGEYRMYDDHEVQELLRKAQSMGLPLEAGSCLEQMTLNELAYVVNVVN